MVLGAGGAQRRRVAAQARGLLVLVQVRLERERLPAARAHVRLGVRVGLHVGAQVGLVGERLGADAALEGLLARVRAHVPLQQPRPREGFAAELAAAGLRVRADVHGEGGDGHVELAARRAPSRLLARQRAVRLPVPRQVAGRRVPLAAVHAAVRAQAGAAARSAAPAHVLRGESRHVTLQVGGLREG